MTILVKEKRDSEEFAASLLETLCPSPGDRKLVLGQLLTSISVASKISPRIWAVTLFDNGFRLNVGPVEVMTFSVMDSVQTGMTLVEVRLLLHGLVDEDTRAVLHHAQDIHEISESHYASVPQPQFVYRGLADISNGTLSKESHHELERALTLLQPMHANFIAHAAKTSSGGIRKSSTFHRSHSPGLHAYAEAFVAGHWHVIHQPEEQSALLEGGAFSVQATVYERNPVARQKCIAHYGLNCVVCGFNFGATYGNTAKNHVHVHHLKPIASIGKEYTVDPISDLRPVCANCHSVIHLRQPPYSIEEVKNMLQGRIEAYL